MVMLFGMIDHMVDQYIELKITFFFQLFFVYQTLESKWLHFIICFRKNCKKKGQGTRDCENNITFTRLTNMDGYRLQKL